MFTEAKKTIDEPRQSEKVTQVDTDACREVDGLVQGV